MRDLTLVGPRGLRLHVSVPGTPLERTRGLLGHDRLEPDRAMLFLGTRSVHTFGMRFPIAVVLLDPELRVLGRRWVPPRRLVLPRRGVRHVLECPCEADVRVGDVLEVRRNATGGSGPGPGVAILPRLPPAARAPIV